LSFSVLDASAVLAAYLDEPGADAVLEIVEGSLVSAVNYSEILSKTLDYGHVFDDAVRKLSAMSFIVVAHDVDLARRTGELRQLTSSRGLSIGDRACLALAERERLPALTADRAWMGLDLPVEIRVIR
jgi:ribonuclease VapC